jgi:uncharacterized membrane protein YhaH (DUF805 family)
MDFKQAVIRCVRDNYANFNGRAARPEFWYFMLACVIVGFVLGMFNMNMLALLFNLAVLLPSLAVGARRLHDIGKSGWLQLVGLIPLLGWILLIYWFVQPTGGPNEYGEGPAVADEPTAVPPGAA